MNRYLKKQDHTSSLSSRSSASIPLVINLLKKKAINKYKTNKLNKPNKLTKHLKYMEQYNDLVNFKKKPKV
jgi:hypothetical protein